MTIGNHVSSTRKFWFRLSIAIVLFLYCGVAHAQETLRPYVVTGVAGEWRDPGGGDSQFVRAITLSAGFFVTPWLGIEGSVDLPASQDFPWGYSYSNAVTLDLGSHRDVVVLGLVRFRPGCRPRLCAEPVVGLGVTIHHAESVVTSSCGSLSLPQPCTAVARGAPSEVADGRILTSSFGFDLLLRVSSRVAIGPTARLYYVSHDMWLFPYPNGPDRRGPSGGSKWLPELGFVARWN